MTALNKYKHNLGQVTFIHPDWHNGYPEYEELLQELDGSTLDNGTPIVVRRRPNVDISYGGFSDVYGDYRTKFDYYLFMEDDYLPCLDNFDSILVDILKEKQCHYLCTLVSNTTWENNGIPHAGMTAGICASAALEVIWQKYESLLLPDRVAQNFHWNGQLLLSYPFHYCGLKIDDFSDRYSAPFWYSQANRIEMMADTGEFILVPIQWYRGNISQI